MHVDLLNNQIGRDIGIANPGLGMRDMASKVVDSFASSGLWVSTAQKDGSYTITRTQISASDYTALQSRLSTFNDNGRTSSAQQQVDQQRARTQQEDRASHTVSGL